MQTAEIVEFPTMSDSKYLGISIDLDRDRKLSEQALKLLKDYYCIDGGIVHNRHLQEHQLHTVMTM